MYEEPIWRVSNVRKKGAIFIKYFPAHFLRLLPAQQIQLLCYKDYGMRIWVDRLEQDKDCY